MGALSRLANRILGSGAPSEDLRAQLAREQAAVDGAQAAFDGAQAAFDADRTNATKRDLEDATRALDSAKLDLASTQRSLTAALDRERRELVAEFRAQRSAAVAQRDQHLDQVAQHQRRQAQLLVESIAAAARAAESMGAAAEQQRQAEDFSAQAGDPPPDSRSISSTPSTFALGDLLLEAAARSNLGSGHRLVHELLFALCPGYTRVRDLQTSAARSVEIARDAIAERRAELERTAAE